MQLIAKKESIGDIAYPSSESWLWFWDQFHSMDLTTNPREILLCICLYHQIWSIFFGSAKNSSAKAREFSRNTCKVRGQSCQPCSVHPYIGPGLASVACDVVMFEAATSIHGRKEEAGRDRFESCFGCLRSRTWFRVILCYLMLYWTYFLKYCYFSIHLRLLSDTHVERFEENFQR